MAFSSASAVPSIGVARCQSVGVVISCGDSGSDNWLLRGPSTLFIACVTNSCSWRSLPDASSLLPASRSSTSSGWRRAEPASGSELKCSPSLRSSSSGLAPNNTPPSDSGTWKLKLAGFWAISRSSSAPLSTRSRVVISISLDSTTLSTSGVAVSAAARSTIAKNSSCSGIS